LCLIDEALNGADDPFREFWSGLQRPVNRAFQRYLFKLYVPASSIFLTPASAPAPQRPDAPNLRR
jgi:hypothetical protein